MNSDRIIIYGDIHGCLDEFIALRKKVNPNSNDVEICVGDILTRGPKDLEVLQYVMQENISSIRGNNDDVFLRFRYESYEDINHSPKSYQKAYNTLQRMTSKEFSFIEKMPFFHKINNLTIIHGGLQPGINLDSAHIDELQLTTRISYLNHEYKYVKPRDKENHVYLWSDIYDGREGFVVYGHHVFDKVKRDKHSLGIDTGCVFGGKLTAAVFSVLDNTVDVENCLLVYQNAYKA